MKGCRAIDDDDDDDDDDKDKGVILDPTIRFEMHEQQPQEIVGRKDPGKHVVLSKEAREDQGSARSGWMIYRDE
ncbi:hypothetical protein ANN_21664 [Periplaneta americana]|uniref:Uncharacterized protein n=1 Tax=Periplaneta americana TaxID=6978 RepID=A0ABQ8S6W3_PERAM|nr:hypothetical protein ANN_21664 [Periplaneta americana]